MINFFIGNVLFRFIPTRIAVAAAKRLGVDIRQCWEFERLYFLGGSTPCAFKYLALRTFYTLSPLGFGMAWGCAMESSFRVLNLLNFRREVGSFFLKRYLDRLLTKELGFIERNIETHSFNNHYLFNVAALFVGAAVLDKKLESDNWLKELVRTVGKQFNSDGSNFEGSTAYHYLTLDLLAQLIDLQPSCKKAVKSAFDYKEAIEFAQWCRYGDCEIWNIGDNDSSYCFRQLGSEKHNRVVQLDFIRNSFSAPEYEAARGCRVKSFPDFGVIFYRDTFVDFALWNTKIGQMGKGGHNHNDCLSITLAVNGVPFIVDPGIYKYSKYRDVYRSSLSHSLVSVANNFEHERFLNNFELSNDSAREIIIEQGHVTALFSNAGMNISRKVSFGSGEFTFTDRVSDGAQLMVAFMLHPDIKHEFIGRSGIVMSSKHFPENVVHLEFERPYEINDVSEYGYSPRYGFKRKSKAIRLYYNASSVCWRLKVI